METVPPSDAMYLFFSSPAGQQTQRPCFDPGLESLPGLFQPSRREHQGQSGRPALSGSPLLQRGELRHFVGHGQQRRQVGVPDALLRGEQRDRQAAAALGAGVDGQRKVGPAAQAKAPQAEKGGLQDK